MKHYTRTLTLFLFISFAFSQTQLGTDIDGEAAGDRSGRSVSMNSAGDRVAIGAYGNDGTGEDAGHVRVYEYSNSSWTQIGSDIDGESADDRSGRSVSMNSAGDRVAIGAYGNDGTGEDAGHVRVYEYSNSSWTQLGSDIDGEAEGDESGRSVSMNSAGDRVAIGALYNDGTGEDAGHVRVYEYSNSSWTQLGSDIDGESADDRSGYSVSMNSAGDRVAIGTYVNDETATIDHVRVYEYSNSSWTQIGSDIDGEAAEDYSGFSLSMNSDGDRVAIGAQTNDGTASDAGHVRIYEYSNSSWTQLGSDIDGEAEWDYSGRVSMNSAGDRVAIGADYNDGTGANAGHVRIYEYSNSSWNQLGSDIDGEAESDYSGRVSMNSAGDRVAIGAYGNDGTGSNAGHVRVYSVSTSTTNSAPVASNAAVTTNEDTDYSGTFSANDANDDTLTYSVLASPSNGTATVTDSSSGTYTYSPTANYNGSDSFTFTASDGTLLDTATVSITVIPVNDAPVANNDTIMVNHNTDYIGQISWSDVDGDMEFSCNLLSNPSNGTVTVSVEGSFVYSPTTDYSGSDSFTFTVCDNSLCDTATVLITIHSLSLDETSLPTEYAVHQNYPNPFNPVTTLRYELPEQTHVNITVYDMLGRKVRTILNQQQDPGYKSLIWDATNNYGKPVSAGIYLYQIQAGEYISTKKMVLLK